MKFKTDIVSNFTKYESDTQKKILLNICDRYEYGVTDSNDFYDRFYSKIKKEFKNNKFGNIQIIEILSYHLVCNMFCVDWPKSETNLIPFKYNYFESCCKKLNDYMSQNNIKTILSPNFGTEILEGNFQNISNIMFNTFNDNIEWILFKS